MHIRQSCPEARRQTCHRRSTDRTGRQVEVLDVHHCHPADRNAVQQHSPGSRWAPRVNKTRFRRPRRGRTTTPPLGLTFGADTSSGSGCDHSRFDDKQGLGDYRSAARTPQTGCSLSLVEASEKQASSRTSGTGEVNSRRRSHYPQGFPFSSRRSTNPPPHIRRIWRPPSV